MELNNKMTCKNCNSNDFLLKKESTFIYTYKVNVSDISFNSNEEDLPFLFDNREEMNLKEYIECNKCQAIYPVNISTNDNKIKLTILQKAIRSDHIDKAEFLG